MTARYFVAGAVLGATCSVVQAAPAYQVAAPQGGVARWSGAAAAECGIYGKRYPAVDASCYYPVDIRARPGSHEIALWDQDGKRLVGTLLVEAAEFPDVELTLPESAAHYLDPSPADLQRAQAERGEVEKVLGGDLRAAQFSLPLGKPVAVLPKSDDDFGSLRRFDAEHSSRHTGRDYPVGAGTPLKAVAAGRVALAAEHFYTGGAVYVDHGGGLVSMLFHLDSIAVETGAEVERGQTLGTVGSTGRTTGPHLHLGLRWLGRRVDPALLLDDPTKLPAVSDSPRVEQAKIDAAERRDVDEVDDTEPED